ncbi:MAG: calcium/sodium antiporter [Spirochaetaceae bacterium]|nr:calcium/sodium antiporter [Spirochaetaceae bacterium]
MDMVIQILLLVLGFALLVKGADWFVDGAAGIATKFGIPQLVIGLTIVAMGTSAPEAAVSITAAFAGNAEITIGNIVGSNVLNILIILGITALVYPVAVQKSSLIFDIPVVLLATAILFGLGYDGNISRLDGIIMLVVFVAYLFFLFWDAKRPKKLESAEVKKEEAENEETKNEGKNLSLPKALIFTVIGLVLIVAGSNFVVKSATFIATALGLSQRFIGLTIVALGTSLPELFTSVTAAMKKNSDIAVGNIVGSNIFNILFIVGLSGLIIPVPFAPAFRFDTLVSGVAAILLLLCSLPKKRLSRIAGIFFLICYAVYFYMIW